MLKKLDLNALAPDWFLLHLDGYTDWLSALQMFSTFLTSLIIRII